MQNVFILNHQRSKACLAGLAGNDCRPGRGCTQAAETGGRIQGCRGACRVKSEIEFTSGMLGDLLRAFDCRRWWAAPAGYNFGLLHCAKLRRL